MIAILVAEDEDLARWSVAEFLREEKYQVDEVGDAQTAISLIDSKNFDAVITDYRMPGGLTGLDVLRHYHQRCPDKAKILITAQNDVSQTEVEAIGGTYLPKPFLLEDLLGIINRRRDI
jgi:two-component system, response regulator PdtaR